MKQAGNANSGLFNSCDCLIVISVQQKYAKLQNQIIKIRIELWKGMMLTMRSLLESDNAVMFVRVGTLYRTLLPSEMSENKEECVLVYSSVAVSYVPTS